MDSDGVAVNGESRFPMSGRRQAAGLGVQGCGKEGRKFIGLLLKQCPVDADSFPDRGQGFLPPLGRPQEALAASEQAISIYRQLAEARPAPFLHRLATALNGQSRLLSALGRSDDADSAARAASEIRHQTGLPDLLTPAVVERLEYYVRDLRRRKAFGEALSRTDFVEWARNATARNIEKMERAWKWVRRVLDG
ncbi:MAG: hypothetical protein ABR922_19500 [Streptosporangiaceae bacterium]